MQELPRRPVKRRLLCALAASVLAFAVVPAPDAQADAPPCRYTISTNTVLDRDTGLTWQRTVDAGSYNHAAAAAYCNGLALDGGGWRLPSIQELQTLVDEGKSYPSIDSTAFPNTPATYFWSSSLYAGGSSDAWYIHFGGGSAYPDPVDTLLRVRCVR